MGQVDNNGFVAFNYSIGTTIGSANNFIDQVSFRGFNFDYRRKISENVSAGLLLGWTHFYQKLDRDLYPAPGNPDILVNAVQSRVLSSLPITLQGHYYFVNNSFIEPYLGFGMGAYRIEYEKWWGAVQDRSDQWKFGINAQLGATVPITKDYVGFNFGLVYHWVPFEYNEIDRVKYLNLNLGIYLNF
jgi:opacity protein-like surface antigen